MRERNLPSFDSLPKCQPGLGQAKAWSHELCQGLPSLSRCFTKELDWILHSKMGCKPSAVACPPVSQHLPSQLLSLQRIKMQILSLNEA